MNNIKIRKGKEQFFSEADLADAHDFYAPVNDYLDLKSISRREIEFLATKPKPLTVQIPLVEYFERIKRHKADRWQRDFCNRLQVAAERRHIERNWTIYHAEAQLGKTSILSQTFPAWLLGHDPLFRWALAMYNVSRSQAHSKVVIQILQSNIHKDIFPNKGGHLLSNVVSAEGWMTNARRELNDGQLSFNPVGLQSGLTGSGFDWLSIDDPYKESKEAFSDTVRENMQNFWDYTVMSRAGEHSCITGMFHRYAPEDFAGFLLDTGDFEYIRYATVCDGDYIHESTGQRFPDPLGRKIGEYISPERRPPSYYEKTRKNKQVWLSMFQGKPSSEEGDFFNISKIKTISREDGERALLEAVAVVRAYDNGATKAAGDYSVGSKMSIRANGRITVHHIWRKQVDSATRLAEQKRIAADDGVNVTIRIPQDPGSAGKFEAWATEQHLEGYTVISRPVSGSKEARALNFSAAVNDGLIEFVDDSDLPEDHQWIKDAKREMRDFPLSEKDDIVDSESDGYNYLYEVFRKGLIIKNYRPQRNLLVYSSFANRFRFFDERQNPILKIPADFTVYAGLKINQEASRPTSGVIVARASHNSNMPDTLFVVDEYKAYDGDFYRLFNWLDRALAAYCENPRTATIWLHEDSKEYQETIRLKLKRNVQVFSEDVFAGIAEANWYLLPTEKPHPFNERENATNLYFLIQDDQFAAPEKDKQGFYHARQEITTWGFNDKGEPSAVGGVMDCLRMVVYKFRTRSVRLTNEQRAERNIPEAFRLENINAQMEAGEMTERQYSQALITRQARLVLPKILGGQNKKNRHPFDKFKRR